MSENYKDLGQLLTSDGVDTISIIIGSVSIVVALILFISSVKYKNDFPYVKHFSGFFPSYCISSTIVVLTYINYQPSLNVTGETAWTIFPEMFAFELTINVSIAQGTRLYLQTAYQRALLEGHYNSNLITNMRKYLKLASIRNVLILSLIEAIALGSLLFKADTEGTLYFIGSIILALQVLIGLPIFIYKFSTLHSGFKDGTGIMFEMKFGSLIWFIVLVGSVIFTDADGIVLLSIIPQTTVTIAFWASAFIKWMGRNKRNVAIKPEEVELTIKHPASADNFAKFLAGEFSSENFYFIVLVLRLINKKKGTGSSAGTEEGLLLKTQTGRTLDGEEEKELDPLQLENQKKDELLDSMRSCYNRFVAINSAYQVNLPGGLIKKFKKAFDKDEQDTQVLMELFLKAKKEIIGLLVRDPFKRWKDSPLYVAVDNINTKLKKTDTVAKLLATGDEDFDDKVQSV